MSIFLKGKKKLIKKGCYLKDNNPNPLCVVAGYTRSGTTFLAELLSNLTTSRYIHEPLTPGFLKENTFHPRENSKTYKSSKEFRELIKKTLSSDFKCDYAEKGSYFINKRRVIKFVRTNFYLKELVSDYRDIKFVYIIRNPLACVHSRLRKNWEVPDYSKVAEENCFDKIQRQFIDDTNDHFYKMVLSWALDNFMALQAKGQKNIKFIFYEDIVKDMTLIKEIINFIGVDVSEKKMTRTISYYKTQARDVSALISGWKGQVSETQFQHIENMLSAFGIDHLYNIHEGLPAHEF